ncbi:MAG: hypothetical protein WKF80_05445 [Thermomicrobiales bacterium]
MDQPVRVPISPAPATGPHDGGAPARTQATPYEVARLVSTLAAYDGVAGDDVAVPDVAGLAKMATFAMWGREIATPLRLVEPPVGTPPGMIDALAAARGESGPVPFDGPVALAAALTSEVAWSAGERAQAAHLAAVAGDDAMAVLFAESALRCDPNRADLQDLLSVSRTRLAGMAATMGTVGSVPVGDPGPNPAAVPASAVQTTPDAMPGQKAAGRFGASDIETTSTGPLPGAAGEIAAGPDGPAPATHLSGDSTTADSGDELIPAPALPEVAMTAGGARVTMTSNGATSRGSFPDAPGDPLPPNMGTFGAPGTPPVSGPPVSVAQLHSSTSLAERPSLAEVQAMERLLGVDFGVTAPAGKPSRSANDPRLVLVSGIVLFVAAMVIGLLALRTF